MTTVTSAERRSAWQERLDPRNWSLVAKLAVVGLVPTVLALSIGAIRVVDQANVAEELSRGSGLVDVHRQIDTLTGTLQAERNAAVEFVARDRPGDRAGLDGAQAATDEAVRTTTGLLDTAEQQAPQLGTAVQQAETTLGQLPVIRSQVAGGPTPTTDVTSRYTAVVQRTLALDRALLGRLQTAETAGLTTALGAGQNALEALALERAVVNGAIASGQLDEAQRAQVVNAGNSFQAAAGDFRASLTPEQAESFGDFAGDRAVGQRQALLDQVLAGPPGSAPAVEAPAWNAAVDTSVQATRGAVDQAEEAFTGERAAAAEQAGNTAGLNSVLLMLTLLLTGGIILLLGRHMVRSLRLLRSSALDVAERKLPAAVQGMRAGQAPNALVEPVPLESRDEIGEVARAFDAVHGQAIRLAADQAALQQNVNSMFVNLSRRSQALVERQLQLIEQLESNEQDPDQLSNLFQLDHLATRMRRNSENLLVLAGTDLAKRNVAPVQVVDVLRAAVSEVEQYQRVVVQTPPTATIAGRAANDLVHLLAELLDNATNFSPPDSQVVMSTTRTADESLLVEISDRGVGMTDAELVDANQRLSGPAEVDVSASRRMGLFVVGRLAARHRLGVRLASATGGGGSNGLSASVTVPPQLVPSAALPEQRRDPGPGAPQVPGRPPQQQDVPMFATADASGGPDEGPAAPRTAVNGAGRGGPLPSMVAGTDGPLTPTFEAGSAGGAAARNGSSAALPTRTPGSALRRNRPELADDAVNGKEASLNGSAPGGLQAFAPSPQQDPTQERSPADVFTPADGGTDGSTATDLAGPPEQGTDPTGTGPHGPGGSGPHGPGGSGPHGPGRSGPDRTDGAGDAGDTSDDDGRSEDTGRSEGTGRSGDTGDERDTAVATGSRTADAGGGAGTGVTDRESDADTVGRQPADGADAGPGPGRIAGAALGATGIAGATAAAIRAGRRTGSENDRTENDGTENDGADTDRADADRTEGADHRSGPAGPPDRREMDDTVVIDAATGDGPPEPDASAARAATAGGDADRAGTDRAGIRPTADGDRDDSGGNVSGRNDGRDDDGRDSVQDGAAREDTPSTGAGTGTAAAAATGAAEPGSGATASEAAGLGGTAEDTTGAATGDTTGTTAAPETPARRTGDTGSTPAVADGGAARRAPADAPDGTADPETASIPTVRPSGREPMGRPGGSGPGGTRPSPTPRPVMPIGRGRGPAPNGAGSAPVPNAPASSAPGQTPSTPAPNTPAPNAPNGVPPLPKRQAPTAPSRPPQGGAVQGGAVQGGAPQSGDQEALFAPKVPVEGRDRGQLRRPGAVEPVRATQADPEFDMSQTTPIFDDIASAWFRSNRSVPVRWQDGGTATVAQAGTAPGRPEESQEGPDTGFASPADDAWRQAREVSGDDAEDPGADDLTHAGLPKRRPRARLLPGSAAGSTVLSPPSGTAEARSADSVRGRLASYQQGVRQGRESASGRQATRSTDGDPEPSGDRPNQSDPEENQ